MMRIKAIFTFVSLLAWALAFGQNWQYKIDPSIFQPAAAGQPVDCIVVLAEKADLSEAAFLPLKKDKREYVFRQLTETAARTQVQVLKTVQAHGSPYQPFYLVNAMRVEQADLALLESLARLPEVGRIDPNPKVRNEMPRADFSDSGDRGIEWNVTHINADDVWTLLGYNGTGIVVSGQDTGYDWDHPALKDMYRGWNDSSADHNYNWHDAIHGLDSHNTGTNPCGLDSPVPCDDDNHGTHTMGTMVGSEGANQIGVAPGAKWIGCRNMERGWGTPTTYLECFEWFLAPTNLSNGNPTPALAPDVINNSWGCPGAEGCNSGNYNILDNAIIALTAAGVMVVASAGNSGSGCSSVNNPPAIYAQSFTVGATNNIDSIASFSSRGPVTVYGNRLKPEISAPGVSVRSSIIGTGYSSFSGTSMAGPHIAGVVALMLDANPNLTVAQLKNILQTTAVDRTSSQSCGGVSGSQVPNNTYGYGRVDALAAVNEVLLLLPVELIDFQGFVQGKAVQTHWQVAPDGSLNHFELERADSRLQWVTVSKQVFLPEIGFYQYLDASPFTGTNYYRLKMVDIDGSIEYSKTIAVRWSGVEVLNISPNPAQDALSVSANWQPGTVAVRIFDTSGRLVLTSDGQVSALLEPLNIDVAVLPSGIYFLKIVTQNGAGLLFQNKFTKI